MDSLRQSDAEKGHLLRLAEKSSPSASCGDYGRGSFRKPLTRASMSFLLLVTGICTCLLVFVQSYIHSSYPQATSRHDKYLADFFGVPSYVIEYAPLIYLDEQEEYMPSDIAAQISFTSPRIRYERLPEIPGGMLTASNLDILNNFGQAGLDVMLTSDIDIVTSPAWLRGVAPDEQGYTTNITSVAIIMNDKGTNEVGDEIVDVFYMYFYAYNRGNTVLGHELGNHVGDWEHNMIRFVNGLPAAIWFSQHAAGEVFTYACLEKIGVRPVGYSARGSHANYAIAGTHDHAIPNLNLPFGFVRDFTSKGKLWDPTLSAYYYHWNRTDSTFESAKSRFDRVIAPAPVAIMNFRGRWGDQRYPNKDSRQETFLGFRKYGTGPTGPWDKDLDREGMCPKWMNGGLTRCVVKDELSP